jgi:hypothetical protein
MKASQTTQPSPLQRTGKSTMKALLNVATKQHRKIYRLTGFL